MALNGLGQNGNFFQPRLNPDAYASQYAKQKGISLEEAKSELRSMHGEPQKHQSINFGNQAQQNKENKPDAITLIALGIPFNVIQQGDNAIKNYAEENNINLPEKRKLNLSA